MSLVGYYPILILQPLQHPSALQPRVLVHLVSAIVNMLSLEDEMWLLLYIYGITSLLRPLALQPRVIVYLVSEFYIMSALLVYKLYRRARATPMDKIGPTRRPT